MKKKKWWKNVLQGIYHYLLFFGLAALLTSCTLSLFVHALSRDLGVILTEENLNRAAKLAFGSVILLSILFAVLDKIRRRLTTEKITKHIVSAARQMMQGNFQSRIAPVSRFGMDDNYKEIIDCFNRMAQELGSLETLRTDFIANVSHEMKTPLAVMQNYGTLLQIPDLTDEKRLEYAKGIAEGSRRMADMMTNILKLNRLENQQIYPQTLSYDLGEQICECLLQYENIWEKAEIEIETELEENVIIQADRELLSLVWNNLFSNAFKFTDSGGKVLVSLVSEEEDAVVKVQDTGCGMTAEVGNHIFEKFYQGDRSHVVSGNGLGLALVKRVVDILHGEICVESTVGVGTVFTVRIRRK